MLSIICNANLNDDDLFRKSKSYASLADEDHSKCILENNSSLFDGLIVEMISLGGETEPSVRLERLKKYINDSVNQENRFDYLALGISCLQMFARTNWLGPVPAELLDLPSVIQQQYKAQPSDSQILSLVKFFPSQSKVIRVIRELWND